MLTVTPRLSTLLKQRNLTQSEFSDMCGVPQATISRFDKNTRHEDLHLFAIALALNVTVEELFSVTYAP